MMGVDIIGVFALTICFLAAALYLATKPTDEEEKQRLMNEEMLQKMFVRREKPVKMSKKNGCINKILSRLGL